MSHLKVTYSKGLTHHFNDGSLLKEMHAFLQGHTTDASKTILSRRLQTWGIQADHYIVGEPDMPQEGVRIEYQLGNKDGRGKELRKGLAAGLKGVVVSRFNAAGLVEGKDYSMVTAYAPESNRDFYVE